MEPTNSLKNVIGLYSGQAMRRSLTSVSSQGFHICAGALKPERLVRTSPLLKISESETRVFPKQDWQSRTRDPSMHCRQAKQRRPEVNKVAWKEAVQHVNVSALERHISRILCSRTTSNVYTDARWIQRRNRSFSLDTNNLLSASELDVSSSATVPRNVSSPKPSKLSRKSTGLTECSSEETGLQNKQKNFKISDEEKTEPVSKVGNDHVERNWKPRSSDWRKTRDVGKNEDHQSAEAVDIVTKLSDLAITNNVTSEPVHIPSFEKKIDQQLEKKSSPNNKGSTSSYVDLSSLNSRMAEDTNTSTSSMEFTRQKSETQLSQKDQLEKVQLINKIKEESFNRNKSSETENIKNEVLNRNRSLSMQAKNSADLISSIKKTYEKSYEQTTTSGLVKTGGKERSPMMADKPNPESAYTEKSSSEISSELRERRRQQLADYVSMCTEHREELEAQRRELLKSDPERYRNYRRLSKWRSIQEIYQDFFPRRGSEWRASSLPQQPATGRLELLGKINDTRRREQLIRSVFGDGPQQRQALPLADQRRSLQRVRSNFSVNQAREFSVDQESRSDCDIKGSLKYMLDFKTRLLQK